MIAGMRHNLFHRGGSDYVIGYSSTANRRNLVTTPINICPIEQRVEREPPADQGDFWSLSHEWHRYPRIPQTAQAYSRPRAAIHEYCPLLCHNVSSADMCSRPSQDLGADEVAACFADSQLDIGDLSEQSSWDLADRL